MHRAIVELPGHDALALAVLGHDEVERKILDEEFGVFLQALAVERVQHGVAGAVGGGADPLHRHALPVFGGMAAERALIDLALFGARKRHTVVFQFIDRLWRFAGDIFHRVHVAEPVRTLDGVEHVPLPAVGSHVAQGCGNSALSGHGMRTGRKDLRHAGGAQALFCHAERGAQTGPAGPDDDHVIFMRLIRISGHVSVLQSASRISA